MIETTELYGGEIKLEFDSAHHQYRVVNKGCRYKVPSVTAVTGILNKPALVPWAVNATLDLCRGAIAPGTEYAEVYLEGVWDAAKKESQRTKSEAASRGTGIHREVESILKRTVQLSSASNEANSLVAWLTSIGTVQDVERRVYSRRYRYSGTCDGLIQTDSGLVLYDLKTGKSIYPEFWLQTAAYCSALEEEFPSQKIEGRYLVRIAEDGSVEPHYFPRSTQRLDFKAFRGALDLFRRVQQIEKESRKSGNKMPSGGI